MIHGVVTWNHVAPESLARRVAAMTHALRHQPWERVEPVHAPPAGASPYPATAAFAAQSRDDEGGPSHAARSGDVYSVSDLRMDGGVAEPVSSAARIVDRYAARGLPGAQDVLGDGVFALWDAREQRLICWRDVAGTRPLYYWTRHDELIFSSDLRSLTADPAVPTVLDTSYARSLIERGSLYQHPRRTLLDGVSKLPAGHVLLAERGRSRVLPHWDPSSLSERTYRTTDEYAEELRHLLDRAVERRLASAGTTAAHVTGGLDSSSIGVLANRHVARSGGTSIGLSWAPPRGFLDYLPVDERTLADAVAHMAGMPLWYTEPDAHDIADVETRDLAVRPVTTLQFEATASRRARDAGVRTILSGWGGDELVVNNGRGYFASLAIRGHWLKLWRETSMRSELFDSSRASFLRGRVLLPLLPDDVAARVQPGLRPVPLQLPDYLEPGAAQAFRSAEPLEAADLRERPGVRQQQIAKLHAGHLQYRMESWASHGADLGLTYQYPLLDRSLIEFALTIPDHLYFRDGWKRWLYRTAMQGVLPEEVRWNPHKFDTALVRTMSLVSTDVRHHINQLVPQRGRSTFVDLERLTLADADPRVGSAGFLAFTEVQPSW